MDQGDRMKKVVMTDKVLTRIALNEGMRRTLPMLPKTKSMPVGGRGCGRCKKRRKRQVYDLNENQLNELRRNLYKADGPIIRTVKNFLQADKLIFYFAGEPGYPQRVAL